jgi:sugar lactone lactonase YvrE
MRAVSALVLLVAIALLPAAAPLPGALPTQPACPDAPTPVLFAQWDTQLENLAFDGAGSLYVSDLGGDRLLSFGADGVALVVDDVPGMHGMTLGPDGLLYVGGADGAGAAGVWRYTSLSPAARELVLGGLEAANGMAFDRDGNLFVSNPLGTAPPYLVRAPAEDLSAWTAWGSTYGTNGLWLDPADGSLVSAITADQSSPIVRISTSAADDVETLAMLSFGAATLQPGVHAPQGDARGVAPKGLDDLTLGPDGAIYVTAHVSGEVLRVDASTGDACVLASGLQEPTSLRFAHGFGGWDGALFITDMGGEGVTALATPGAGAVWVMPLDG